MQSIAAFTALNRFGLGNKPGGPAGIADNPQKWLKDQVFKASALAPSLQAFPSSAKIMKEIHEARRSGDIERRKETGRKYRKNFAREVTARARHMISTDTPFAERMVLFWSNHFTVSRTRAIVGPAMPAYEREAIRPHVFGKFEDMLLAAAGHIAMLTYLDNINSIGPNSRAGKRRGKTINENLAREILELHTLGVNGGYTQNDVIEVAKALTGWSHGGIGGKKSKRPVHGEFEFRPVFHEPGPKTVLGKKYRENGVNEAMSILRDLARHPSTATFIATKLVRHFVSDAPPRSAVENIAKVFLDSGGDLAAVSRALVDLDDAWAEPLAKVKTPYELVVSTFRAVGKTDFKQYMLNVPLRTLGHQPFNAPSPAGWPDSAAHWIAPEALMRRIEWARALSARLPVNIDPRDILTRTIGPVASDATKQMVDAAPSGDAALALIFASAEFQRR